MNRKQLFLFMLGQLGIMMLARFFFQWIMRFADFSKGGEALFVASTVGTVLLGFRIFDGVTDPAAGVLSDWWVRKGKKRQNLLWAAFVLPAIGLILCFSPTHEMSEMMRWAILLSGFFIFFVGYTIYAIPYWSLVGDYAGGSEDVRRALSNMLGLGLILATIVGFVISPLLIGVLGYPGTAILFSIAAMLFMVAPIYAAPERSSIQPVLNEEVFVEISVSQSFLTILKDLRFLSLLCLLAGSQMSFTVLTAAAPFIAVNLLQGSESDVSLLLGPLILTSLPMFYFAPRISSRFGWKNALLTASFGLGIVYFCASAIGTSIFYSETVTAMLIFGCGGPMIALLLAVEGEAITACALVQGASSVSLYFGVFNLVVKALNGLALSITGLLIVASKGPWGSGAIRFMVISAGIMLLVGLISFYICYFFDKRRQRLTYESSVG